LDINARDSAGDTCLHKYAALSSVHFECYPYKKQNVMGRVNPGEYDYVTDTSGIWPSSEIISILLSHKVDCTIINMNQQTPFTIICEMGWISIASKMIENATIDVKFEDWPRILNGRTPLHHLLHCCHRSQEAERGTLLKQSITSMLNNGADTNARSWNLRTPLHVACVLGLNRAARLIAKHNGTNVNLQDQNGRTPLHYVIENWIFDNDPIHVATALCLMECGADLSIKDNNDVVVADHVATVLRELPATVKTSEQLLEYHRNKFSLQQPPNNTFTYDGTIPYGALPRKRTRFIPQTNDEEKQEEKNDHDEYQALTQKLSDILNQGQK